MSQTAMTRQEAFEQLQEWKGSVIVYQETAEEIAEAFGVDADIYYKPMNEMDLLQPDNDRLGTSVGRLVAEIAEALEGESRRPTYVGHARTYREWKNKNIWALEAEMDK